MGFVFGADGEATSFVLRVWAVPTNDAHGGRRAQGLHPRAEPVGPTTTALEIPQLASASGTNAVVSEEGFVAVDVWIS